MLSKLFASQPVLEEQSISWIFDVYAWALNQFDANIFFNETILVAPTNKYFPGEQTSVTGMAELIFSQVQNYAHLQHWQCTVVDHSQFTPPDLNQLALPSRTIKTTQVSNEAQSSVLSIPYDPQMVANPEALISSYAHILAQYLGSQATESPPGGSENWLMVTELLGVFLGFGLMYANSATTAPSSCSSCSAGLATRPSFVSQYDLTYALAVFSVVKGIPEKKVSRHLKKSLKGFLKSAIKDVKSRSKEIEKLQALRNQAILPNAKTA